MKRIIRLTLVAGACVFVVIAIVVYTSRGRMVYSTMAAPWPEAWLRVKRGMTMDEVRNLIGAPTMDVSELKWLDRWMFTRNGVELHIDVYYDHTAESGFTVERAARFKRMTFSGGPNFDMHVDPPWP